MEHTKRTLLAVGILSCIIPVSSVTGGAPQVCVIVKTYAAHLHSLPVTLAGIFSDQHTRQLMRAIVVETDSQAPFPGLELLVKNMNTIVGFDGVFLSPRSTSAVKARFPRLKTDDYGYLVTVR